MKKAIISIILTLFVNLTFSQNFALVYVSGELSQLKNGNWITLKINDILADGNLKLEGENPYAIISDSNGDLRRINENIFKPSDVSNLFSNNTNLSKEYFAYIYRKFLKKKEKEKNTAIGGVTRSSNKHIRPFNGSLVNNATEYLQWDKGMVNLYYLQLYSNKKLLLDTIIKTNRFEISEYTKNISTYQWYVSDEYFDINEIRDNRNSYSFTMVETFDEDLSNDIEKSNSIADIKERLYFLSLIYETNNYYDLAYSSLQKLVEMDSSKQHLIDDFLERR